MCVRVYLYAVFKAVHTASRARGFVFSENDVMLVKEHAPHASLLPSASHTHTHAQLALPHQFPTFRNRYLRPHTFHVNERTQQSSAWEV